MKFYPEVHIPVASREQWERGPAISQHNLAQSPLFQEDALVELLDRTPKENLFALHMGHDPELNAENRLALHDGLSGADLLRAVKNGRLWLNVTRIGTVDKAYQELASELYRQVAAQVPGMQADITTVTLLVSSPNALVYYHVDGPASLLWHIRGEKRIWIYPIEDRLIRQTDLEDIFAGVAHEYIPYKLDYDSGAQVFDLEPGMLASWPANSPHRVTNGPVLNVSLSTEHFTPRHRRKARIYRANRMLRLALGMRELDTRCTGARALAKQVMLGVASRTGVGVAKSAPKRHEPALRVSPDAPGGVVPL
jgi:hypothetical protein